MRKGEVAQSDETYIKEKVVNVDMETLLAAFLCPECTS